jgi:hypothetical protein
MKCVDPPNLARTNADPAIDINTLRQAIKAAGGGEYAIEGADSLLARIRKIEAARGCSKLLAQLIKAKDAGDFRGRVLEVNVAARFVENGISVDYGAKQGMAGDIDLKFDVDGTSVYLELKHLGLDQRSKTCMTHQIEQSGTYTIVRNNDLGDIARLQRDLIAKSSTKKFNPAPGGGVINLVGIDVSELQLGTVDVCDCLLAAGGNGLVRADYHAACLRPPVVGIFEGVESKQLSADQKRWVRDVHQIPQDAPHPGTYIHGAVFLFRNPSETAALTYDLRSALVWNANLVSREMASPTEKIIYEALPVALSRSSATTPVT